VIEVPLHFIMIRESLTTVWARVVEAIGSRRYLTADVVSRVMVECGGMHERSEAFHALKLVSACFRIRRRWLTRGSGSGTCRGGCSRVSFLGDDALVLFVLNHVAGLVPQALSSCERIDERFGLDSPETLRETLV
jgi:hypothetical protein